MGQTVSAASPATQDCSVGQDERVPARILFTCRPLTGHYSPLVPLATAAHQGGHAVAFATDAPILSEVSAAGFAAIPAGNRAETRAEWAARFPGFDRLVGDAQRTFFFTKIFADIELAPRAADLERIVSSWRPDLVVHEIAELGAPLVCTAAGIPYVDVGYGSLVPLSILEASGAAAASHWRERGLEPDRFAGLFRHLYIDTCPPSLETDEINLIGPVQPMRPAAAGSAAGPISSDPIRPDRPLVYVTMGTVWNRDLGVFRRILEALADQPLDVVATVGRTNDPEALGPQPPNVSVHRWIAQDDVLPRCALVIAHGGAGTTLGALAHGVPLIVVPQGADQFNNAERVVRAGAGRLLLVDDLRVDALRGAVADLLDDPAYRRAARAVAGEIAAMPTAASVLPVLELLLDG
jgi:UDP:flavonoid glycosyltransferase YjiC (YdhE family)